MKVDIHAHEYPDAFLKEYGPLMNRGRVPRLNVDVKGWDLELHISALDEVGIDLQVISLTLPAYLPDVSPCVHLIQIGNEGMKAIRRTGAYRIVRYFLDRRREGLEDWPLTL